MESANFRARPAFSCDANITLN